MPDTRTPKQDPPSLRRVVIDGPRGAGARFGTPRASGGWSHADTLAYEAQRAGWEAQEAEWGALDAAREEQWNARRAEFVTICEPLDDPATTLSRRAVLVTVPPRRAQPRTPAQRRVAEAWQGVPRTSAKADADARYLVESNLASYEVGGLSLNAIVGHHEDDEFSRDPARRWLQENDPARTLEGARDAIEEEAASVGIELDDLCAVAFRPGRPSAKAKQARDALREIVRPLWGATEHTRGLLARALGCSRPALYGLMAH